MIRAFVYATLVLAGLSQTARSADFRFDSTNGTLYIEGVIEAGDDERFRQQVVSLIKQGQSVRELTVYSPGGAVNPALAIGRQVHLLRLRTNAPIRTPTIRKNAVSCFRGPAGPHWTLNSPYENQLTRNDQRCMCASACFLIWAAGYERHGDYIGLHRPYFDKAEFAQLSPTQAAIRYNKLSKHVADYLREMRIPDGIVDKMMAASSAQLFMLTSDEARLMRDDPSLTELNIARCGDLETTNLQAAEAARRRNMGLFRELRSRLDKIEPCWTSVMQELAAESATDYISRYGTALPPAAD